MRAVLAALCLACLGAAAARAEDPAPEGPRVYQETPYFRKQLETGKLPPVAERLPKQPRVMDLKAMGAEPGQPGGTWRMLMGDQRDLRMMTIYSYARLVAVDEKLNFVPDILQSLEVERGRIFTLHIRDGHKWSDGQPFTAEDFRYWWEDVANNRRLSPSGPNLALISNGKPPKFEIIDPLTVRYSWDDPNPGFLPALAGAQPVYIYMPAHYLKQFHERYADKAALDKVVTGMHVMDWGALHERMSRQYRPENPKLPTLEPWRNMTKPPAEQFTFERNPFFHRVDAQGHQLPYIDTVLMSLGTATLVPAKTASGEANLQGRYLHFEDYTFLKATEQLHDYHARLWIDGYGSYAALYPNLNAKDRVWRKVLRDVRFRRAVSLGINRHDINQVIFFGLARESANTVLPQSPLFRPELAAAYANYDVAEANRLLDEMGLDKRDGDGIRLLPDGRRAEITIETAGEDSTLGDILELVGSDWAKLGLKAYAHPSHLEIFRKRIVNGETLMSISRGLDNGLPTAQFEPDELAPLHEAQYQWPRWGLNNESSGKEGDPVDMPEASELIQLYRTWRHSSTVEEQQASWAKLLDLNASQVFTIGIVNGTRQPVVVANDLHNVPEEGQWAFEPGAFLGIYLPDTFWFTASKS